MSKSRRQCGTFPIMSRLLPAAVLVIVSAVVSLSLVRFAGVEAGEILAASSTVTALAAAIAVLTSVQPRSS